MNVEGIITWVKLSVIFVCSKVWYSCILELPETKPINQTGIQTIFAASVNVIERNDTKCMTDKARHKKKLICSI